MADEPNTNPVEPNKPKSGEPPVTPKPVAKTPLKTPREIELEKQNARLEKRLDDLDAEVTGVKDFLQGLEIGGPKPVEIKPGKVAGEPPPARRGFFEDINRDLYGEN